MTAKSIPSFKSSGSSGSSADLPLTIWNSPSGDINALSVLGRYQSKSQRILVLILGISKIVAVGVPLTLNTLELKSNVDDCTYAGDDTVPVPMYKFLTPGLKSRKSAMNLVSKNGISL